MRSIIAASSRAKQTAAKAVKGTKELSTQAKMDKMFEKELISQASLLFHFPLQVWQHGDKFLPTSHEYVASNHDCS